MNTKFGTLDWAIVGAYLLFLLALGWWTNRRSPQNAADYFLGGNSMSFGVVAISVLATTQSAATFLGGPDQGYRGNFTYLTANIGAVIAAVIAARVLIPRFYAMRATTVYELLGARYGTAAMRAAGGMYLVGRLFASGARLYLAAIAVSMILFSDIAPGSVISGALIMMVLGFVITFLGGIRSVIWTDTVQFLVYVGAAITVLGFLLYQLPLSPGTMLEALSNAPPDGTDKLEFFNWQPDFTDPFAMMSILTGLVLLNLGNFGMDQDTTQRLLTCKDPKSGARAMIGSSLLAVPVIFLFIAIGQLLHLYYDRPDLVGLSVAGGNGGDRDSITVFMRYILDVLPTGLKGLVTVGVIAASISTINSGLNSMSSVLVQDFYRPWLERLRIEKPDRHFVNAGRLGMALVGIALFAMSVLCFYWQRYSNMPLLDFALSVMVFAYSGLLGVFFCAVFTHRGSNASVVAALVAGFVVTLLQRDYVVDTLGLPAAFKYLAFSWQLCIGAATSFVVCALGRSDRQIAFTPVQPREHVPL